MSGGPILSPSGHRILTPTGRQLLGPSGAPCCCADGGCCGPSINFQIVSAGIGFNAGCLGRPPTTWWTNGNYGVTINSFLAGVNATRCLTWGTPTTGGQAGIAGAARWRWVDPNPFTLSVIYFDDGLCAEQLCTVAGLVWNVWCVGGDYAISAGTVDWNTSGCQWNQGAFIHPCAFSPGRFVPCQQFLPGEEFVFYGQFTLPTCGSTAYVGQTTSPTANFIGNGAGSVTITAGGC